MSGHISDRPSSSPGRGEAPALRLLMVSGMIPVRYYITLTLITWGFLLLNFITCPAVKFSLFFLHQALAIGFCLILWSVATVYLERKYRFRPGV